MNYFFKRQVIKRENVLKFIFYTFFFLFGIFSGYTQNKCLCDESISLNKSDYIDSLKVFKNIENLQTKNCEYIEYSIKLRYYLVNKKYKEALRTLQELEEYLNTINCSDSLRYELSLNWTEYYKAINDLNNLSTYAFKTLNEAEKLNDFKKEIVALKHVVFLFTRMNKDEKIWKYVKRVENLISNINNEKEKISNYRWLAYQYENVYTISGRMSLIDSTLIFINKVKNLAVKANYYDEAAKLYRALEASYYHKKNLNKALKYIDSAIYFAKLSKHPLNLGGLYLSKSWDHLDLNQKSEANKWMDSALVYNNTNDRAGMMMLYYEASNIYEGTGSYRKSLNNFKKYNKLKDSILDIKTLEKVNELEQKYSKAKNEQKISELEKTKQFYFFTIVISLLVFTIIVFFLRHRTLKGKQKNLETEQRLSRARINPHFFFNAMSSLQRLSQEENSIKAAKYTSLLAKLMRKSLESTYEDVITIEQEIGFLNQYLEIQKLRYPKKFDFNIVLDNDLEINELKLPGMITQPFIENAIEHGFKSIDYTGMIDVVFKVNNEQLIIEIKDNGRGEALLEENKMYKSRAMDMIKDRLYLFNKKHNAKAFFEAAKRTNQGFKIVITLPVLY